MYCQSCGTANAPGVRYCTNCGNNLAGISMPQNMPYVPNYLAQAILTTIFCCFPFGIVSIVFAAQVNGHLQRGDLASAQRASNSAKTWAWVAFGCVLGVPIIYGGVLLFGLAQASNVHTVQVSSGSSNHLHATGADRFRRCRSTVLPRPESGWQLSILPVPVLYRLLLSRLRDVARHQPPASRRCHQRNRL